jgi:hypothetical protein
MLLAVILCQRPKKLIQIPQAVDVEINVFLKV